AGVLRRAPADAAVLVPQVQRPHRGKRMDGAVGRECLRDVLTHLEPLPSMDATVSSDAVRTTVGEVSIGDCRSSQMKVTRLGRTGIVAGVAAAALAAGGVGIASATGTSGSTPTDLTTAKQKADKRFDAAQQRLTKLKTRVDGAKVLTSGHKSLLDSE